MDPTIINTCVGIAAGMVTIITGGATIKKALQERRTSQKAPKQDLPPVYSRPVSTQVKSNRSAKTPAGPIEGVEEFSHNESGYQSWLQMHPRGFVINTSQPQTDQWKYMVLHKATCGHISHFQRHNPGAFTEGELMKVCAIDIESLRQWARLHGRPDGSEFTSECPCSRSVAASSAARRHINDE